MQRLKEMDDSDNKENDLLNEDDDSFVENLHQLTNLLPNKGDAVVQIYWILPDCHDLNTSNTLPLFGALKRLQECHNALLEIVSSGPEIVTGSFLDIWKKWLVFTICNQDDLMLPDMPIWHGSLTYMGHEENKLLSLPGFALIHDAKNSRNLYLECDEDRVDSSNSKPSLLLSDIQLLHFTPRNNIPIFLFLPFKLKLRLLDENDLNLRQFLQELRHTFAKGLCLLACITLKPKPEESCKSNLKSWMEFVISSTGGEEQQDRNNQSTKSGCARRLCVIDRDHQDNVSIYPFRQTESINGGLYEHLENMTRGKQIVENSQKGSELYLKDLTDHFIKDQKETDLTYLQDVRDQIEKLINTNTPLTSKSLCEIMFSAEKSCPRPDESSSLNSQNSFHLDLSTTSTNGNLRCSSDLTTSPRLWRERLWLMHKDPAKLQAQRKSLAVPLEDLFSISAKDILKRFRRDGRPTKEDLSPLRPANKSENYININTTEAAIQETHYPESLIKRFHGVEYCLDSSSSLSKDTQLSQTQNSVIRQETLSLSSELIPRTFPKKTKTAAQLKLKNEVLESVAKKELRQNRSTKRRSPSSSQTSKQKRKRADSPASKEENSSELTKGQETRSQRHKRRLRLVVDKTLDENGISKDNCLYTWCSERLYALIKSFLKDLKSSYGLNETMKELARSNVEQVINFEKTRLRLQEKKGTKSRDNSVC